jgi:DNA-binding response OmpR family regulator
MKILIVEDDHFFQKFYSNKLSEAGYTVEVASDGNEGLTKMISGKPDLILLDLIMPNKDGFEVLDSVSKTPELKGTPIIIFSTLGDDADVKRALQLGAVDYINKSFHDIENLKAKINAHLPGNAPPNTGMTNQVAPQPAQAPVSAQQPVQQPAPQPQVQPTNGNPTRTT